MSKRILLILFIIFSLLLISSFGVEKQVEQVIKIKPDGTGIWEIEETINMGELSEIYSIHDEALRKTLHSSSKNEEENTWKQFKKELSKIFYQLYGTAPKIEDFKYVSSGKKNNVFYRKITVKISGLIQGYEKKGTFIFSRKHFKSEKDMLNYFENELDGKIFETAFLESVKKSRMTTLVHTKIILPDHTKIKEVLSPFEKRTLESRNKWSVDFGSGTRYEAKYEIKENGDHVEIEILENIKTSVNKPSNLLGKNTEKLFNALRDYTAFDVIFVNEKINANKLSKPRSYNPKEDFYKSWSYTWSKTLSYNFKYQTLSVKPGVTVSLTFGSSLKWEYHWVKHGWFSWSYEFKKFEGKIWITPGMNLFLNVNSSSSLSKSWSKSLFTKNQTYTFWVSTIPVVIVLRISSKATASVGISGSIGFNVNSKFNLNTTVKFTYKNGSWSRNVSKSYNYSGVNFSASAKVNAWSKGELPFIFNAYVYYIAGPKLQLTPWIRADVNASVGDSNQVGYTVKGGMKLTGGVAMAGWLKSICSGAPSAEYTLWSKTWTLKSGKYTF